MARPKISLNHGQMAALLRSAQVREPLSEVADRWAGRARAGAPVDSGEYRSGIRRESETTDRAVERVVAHDPKSSAIEARTGNLKRAMGR